MKAVHALRLNRASTMAVIVGTVLVVGGAFKVYQTVENVHKAICALRAERIQGVQSGKEFLAKHPNGVTLQSGDRINRADLERTIKTQQQTVRAFRFADC